MARWEEALDAKLDLYTFVQSPRGQNYIKGWLDAEVSSGHLNVREHYLEMVDRVAACAFIADPIWVDPDLQTLWEAAVPSFEPEPLHEQDLLTKCGFVYLPRPHYTTDVHGRRTSFRAFAWGTTMLDWTKDEPGPQKSIANFPGVLLFVFHQVGDADDYDNGRGDAVGYNEDGSTKYLDYHAGGMRRGDLILDFVYPWPYGAKVDEDGVRRLPLRHVRGDDYVFDPDAEGGVTGEAAPFGKRVNVIGPDNIEKHVQCLWRLMQQTIATRTEFAPTRRVGKRYEHAKVDSRKITVITLRKPSGTPTGNHRDVEWSHRWLVAGHWRQQPYPTLGITRQIWISPYIKGPEDRPLDVRKERVFELVR